MQTVLFSFPLTLEVINTPNQMLLVGVLMFVVFKKCKVVVVVAVAITSMATIPFDFRGICIVRGEKLK